MSHKPKTIAENYPTYAEFEGQLDPDKAYITVENTTFKKILKVLNKLEEKEQKCPALEHGCNAIELYFRNNTIQLIFQDVGYNPETQRLSTPEFHELLQTIANDGNGQILIVDNNTVVMEETNLTRALLGNDFTITPSTANEIQKECAFQKNMKERKETIMAGIKSRKIQLS